MRNAPRVQPSDSPREVAEPPPWPFVAPIEQKLHAQTHPNRGEPAFERRGHFFAPRCEPLRRRTEASDAGKHQDVGVERRAGIGDAIRVGVGPWNLMEAFLRALDEVRR